MKNKYLLPNIILLYLAVLALLCNMVYWLFPFRPIVWRVLFVLCSLDVVISRNCFFDRFEKSVICFLGLNLIYFLISLVLRPPDFGQIGNILVALLSIPFFSYMGRQGLLSDCFLTIVGILLLVGAIFGYYHMQTVLLSDTIAEAVTVSATSAFLMLLPLFMIIKSDLLKILGYVTCMLFIIAGAKRGNIVASIIPSFYFALLMVKGGGKKSVFKAILVTAAILFAGRFLYMQFLSNDFLMYRVEQTMEGNSSGRDVIYANAWNAWFNSGSFLNFIFGFGFDGTIHHPLMKGVHAHNDWLEVLVDYGIVGVLFYLIVFVSFFKLIRKRTDLKCRMVLYSVFFIWVFKTAYSMGFTEANLSLLSLSVGACLSHNSFDAGLSERTLGKK